MSPKWARRRRRTSLAEYNDPPLAPHAQPAPDRARLQDVPWNWLMGADRGLPTLAASDTATVHNDSQLGVSSVVEKGSVLSLTLGASEVGAPEVLRPRQDSNLRHAV